MADGIKGTESGAQWDKVWSYGKSDFSQHLAKVSFEVRAAKYFAANQRAEAMLKKHSPKVVEYVEEMTANRPQFYLLWLKLWELTCLLEKINPSYILELGCGLTTGVLVNYQSQSARCDVITIDENGVYMEQVRTILHKHQPYSRVVWRNKDVVGDEFLSYDLDYPFTHDEERILLYVDGPANSSPDGGTLPCVDATRIVNENIIDTIVFDMRKSSVLHFLENCVNASHYDVTFGWGCVPPNDPWYLPLDCPYHTVMRKRSS